MTPPLFDGEDWDVPPDEPPPRKFPPALARSFRRGNLSEALDKERHWSELGGDPARVQWDAPKEIDLSKPLGPLEASTLPFRTRRERELRAKASEHRETARKMADVQQFYSSVGVLSPMSDSVISAVVESSVAAHEAESAALASAKWYENRACGQAQRFATVAGCGAGSLHIACRSCSEALGVAVPAHCSVTRVCGVCAERLSLKRQKRLAGARVAALFEAQENGLLEPTRRGGAVSEKMLTLTVPHIHLADVAADSPIEKKCRKTGEYSSVAVRIFALTLAWPIFRRSVRDWLKAKDPIEARSMAWYRFFEWTEGHDLQGHPHIHAYLLSRFLPLMIREEDRRGRPKVVGLRIWWARALRAVGVALPVSCRHCEDGSEGGGTLCPGNGKDHVIIDIRALYGLPVQRLRELAKSGDRTAIEFAMGKLCEPGRESSVENYAGGWTMSKAFEALAGGSDLQSKTNVYCALEGIRLCQGSRGFLKPLPKPQCGCCGGNAFIAGIVNPCDKDPTVCNVEGLLYSCRGPPN